MNHKICKEWIKNCFIKTSLVAQENSSLVDKYRFVELPAKNNSSLFSGLSDRLK